MQESDHCPRCQAPCAAQPCLACGFSTDDGDGNGQPDPSPTVRNPGTRASRRKVTAGKKQAGNKAKKAGTAKKEKVKDAPTRAKAPRKRSASGTKPRGKRISRAKVADEAIGKFEGRYEILGELGKGGMGVVFKAYDRELDEVIALKSLAEAVRTDPRRIAYFKNEIRLARKLSHPNIARVHDLVEVHGRLCLSMAFIPGRSLDAIIKEQGKLDPSWVLRYLGELVPALALAHDSGIVHRDIKPANIIVDANHSPHIVDFGIASSGSSSSADLVGTPSYMAPECWLVGKPGVVVDARCDLYALGITLYELVCGHVPFRSKNRKTLLEMHCERAPRRPQAIVPGVPDALDAVIMKLLEKEPQDRLQKAADILEALESKKFRAGIARGVTTRPHGSVPPILKPPGSRGKILLADGDPEELERLGKRVREHHFLVVGAEDGAQAVEKAFLELPDLILLDSNLAVVDVLDVIRLLSRDERTQNIPVVVLSRLNDPGHEALARDVGAASYFVKPIPSSMVDLLIGRYFG